MQPGLFLGQHLRRCPPGGPVHPGVHPVTELLTRLFQLSEAGVLLSQVHLGRDQIGLGDPHTRFGAALRSGVGRHAGVDHHRVVPGHLGQLSVPHRDPGDVLDRHGLLVVSQHIRRHPTQATERHIQGGEHRRQGLVPDREHHPEPRPGQPSHEQGGLDTVDDRPVTVVVLQPHPRLGDPRPVHPPPARMPGRLQLSHRTPGGAFRAGVSQPRQLRMDPVGANLALGPVDPLLDLVQERVDQLRAALRPARQLTGTLPRLHIPLDGVVGTTRQLRCVPIRPSQVVSIQNVHDLLGSLQNVPSSGSDAIQHRQSHPRKGPTPRKQSGQRHHFRADPMTATGQVS